MFAKSLEKRPVVMGYYLTSDRDAIVAGIIAGKKANLTLEEARDLANRAIKFKADRGRLPLITAADPWERRLAEGIWFLQRKTAEAKNG